VTLPPDWLATSWTRTHWEKMSTPVPMSWLKTVLPSESLPTRRDPVVAIWMYHSATVPVLRTRMKV
jgi:hypothetical protein